MKKFSIVLFAMIGLCSVSFAADAFLGWNCKDNAALKAAIAKDNKDVPVSDKAIYALMIAENENPANVNTLAKCTTIVKNVYVAAGVKEPKEQAIFTSVITYFYCRQDKTILEEINASPLAKDNLYYKTYYVVVRNWSGIPLSEYKEKLFESLEQNIKSGGNNYLFNLVFKRFLELSIEDDSNVVLKKLQILYRMAVPKLDTHEKMKPIVVKISLALKAYGVEVK